jgi:phosphoribosyl-ATP pyrophosphohydrolase
MKDELQALYDVILERRDTREEGSYTCYLFEKGLDKILKKCGEECTEMIIAAKNADNGELTAEMCDLLYHMLILAAEKGVTLFDLTEELAARAKKTGNLKTLKPKNIDT